MTLIRNHDASFAAVWSVVGLLATLASAVSPALAQFLGRLAGWPAWCIVTVARRAAAMPLAAIGWPSSLLGALLLGAAVAVLVPLGRRLAGHTDCAICSS